MDLQALRPPTTQHSPPQHPIAEGSFSHKWKTYRGIRTNEWANRRAANQLKMSACLRGGRTAWR